MGTAQSILNVILNLEKTGTGETETTTSLQSVEMGVMTLNQAWQLGQQVLQTVQGAVNSTVGAFANYAGEVQQLHILTGGTTQDTSRLISLFGDYGGTVNDLVMAQKTLAKTGQSLTVDTLAKMSDQFLALGSASAQTDFLIKNFGRSGADLATIMSQGSAAILAQSAAVTAGLVLTPQAVTQAQNYTLALARETDQLNALKISVGEASVGPLTTLLTTMTELGQIQQNIVQFSAAGGGIKLWEYLLPGAQTVAGVQDIVGLIQLLTGHVHDNQTVVENNAQAWNTFWASAAGGGSEGATGTALNTLDGEVKTVGNSLDIAFQKLMNLLTYGQDVTDVGDAAEAAFIKRQQAGVGGGGGVPAASGGSSAWVVAGTVSGPGSATEYYQPSTGRYSTTPGHAAGGPVGPGTIWGEGGKPEILVTSSGGQILSHDDAMRAAGGGGGQVHYHIHYSPTLSLGNEREFRERLFPYVDDMVQRSKARH